MGVCLSAQIKAESSSQFNSGASTKNVSDENSAEGPSSNRNVSKESAAASVAAATPKRSEGEILQSPNLTSFSFSNLKLATKNFRSDTVVGEGGFGSVFKGWIDESTYAATKAGTGMVVAVKKLKQESVQGHSEWLAEVNYLGQFVHPHLVKLLGYCVEDEHRLLVYEFLPRGSLENHLFRRGSYFQPLSWKLRLKVAHGAAEGLAFLHSSETKVIYRDFKTSNILLDTHYDAKLCDFGLAKDGPTGDKSHVSTRIMGTYGYAAPEYLATGHLTAKNDVYSFGVVLLEMLSGRRAIDKNRPAGEHNLVEWAKPFLANKRKLLRILDNRLEGQYALDVAFKVAVLAHRCISVEAKLRPSMDEVVAAIEEIRESNETASADSDAASNAPRLRRRRSADDTGGGGGGRVSIATAASYPRPSASPLYASVGKA